MAKWVSWVKTMWQVLFKETIMEYSKDYISEFMKWIDPFSILIIADYGLLRRIYCPFTVEVVRPVAGLQSGDVVSVDAVKITLELKDVFIIEGKAYYIIHFRILI